MHRSASPRPGFRPSSRSGSLANSTPLSPRPSSLTHRDSHQRDQERNRSRDHSPALNFLARRGSEANRNSDEDDDHDSFEVVDADEAMANAERDLKADAEWKRIQQNTFTRWANEHLKQASKQIDNLETELSDGLKLISLIEVLSGKRMPRHNKKPVFRSQKLENVSIALQFLEREGVTLVNIDSTDIVDCKLKLILGLIWTLILHYAISMPMWDGPPLGGAAEDKTPKQRLLGWVKDKLPDLPVHNFTTDWNNGKAVGALVDSVAPGLCPDWEDWDPKRPLDNAKEAMDLADQWLNVPKLLTPEEMINPNLDEQSLMTYLSQFPNAKLKPGAPLRQKTNPSKVRAYGPGLEPKGLVANAPAKFTVETFGAGDGEVVVQVKGPTGNEVKCDIVFNNDRKQTYSCSYFPEEEGDYVVIIKFANREIPKSPYHVNVEGFAGDASKVTASGPGLEPDGVVVNRPTYFDIFTEGAGKGTPEVIILDPKGKKDSCPIKISASADKKDVYRCEYVATNLGLHSVNVFYAGNPIPDSPFGVRVAPASQPNKVWASGRGLQPNGIRVNETVDFKVYTEGAGEGLVAVKIIGPGGKDVSAIARKVDEYTTEYTYCPQKEGRHIIMITFANQEIPRSPFNVNIGPYKTSKIKAYGPGLKGGIVNRPAVFTVDTCGETGALGFSIEGPSQAKINCKDNGDGSADVDYLPTAVGEYAIHILCDKEDIPGSPFMSQIVPATDFYPEKVRAFGPGLENGVSPKEKTYFTIDITEAGDAPLEVMIVDDDGHWKPDIKKKSDGIFDCSYMPRKGMHKQTIYINFGGVAIPGSPFHVTNDNPNDPTKVQVYGPGVEKGVRVNVPAEFTVDCTQSGPGDVKVKIESSKRKSVPVSINDNKDGTYTVTYEAKEAGPQRITITLDDTEVPQSPIRLDIRKPLDLSKIKISDLESRAFVDCVNDFIVDLSALPPDQQRSALECKIKGPKTPVDTFINKLGPNGPYQVSYTPTEVGEHEIDLRYDDTPLPDSPYPVDAERGCDPSKVKALGDGLTKGIVDEVNSFTVETKNAGTGELGIAVEGPSESQITCQDNKDGTCSIDYIPTEEGDYDVTVKFGDQHIPGSPFKVPVTTRSGKRKADANKVHAYGPGLEPGQVFPGKPTTFTVDSTETGEAPVEVSVDVNGKRSPRKPSVTKKSPGVHEVGYVPPPVGDPYTIHVKYGGLDIPGSPFDMTSNPDLGDISGPSQAKRQSSLADDENYEQNGTGLQRRAAKSSLSEEHDDKDKSKRGGGIKDLVRSTMPGLFGGKRKGSKGDDDQEDEDADRRKKDGKHPGGRGSIAYPATAHEDEVERGRASLSGQGSSDDKKAQLRPGRSSLLGKAGKPDQDNDDLSSASRKGSHPDRPGRSSLLSNADQDDDDVFQDDLGDKSGDSRRGGPVRPGRSGSLLDKAGNLKHKDGDDDDADIQLRRGSKARDDIGELGDRSKRLSSDSSGRPTRGSGGSLSPRGSEDSLLRRGMDKDSASRPGDRSSKGSADRPARGSLDDDSSRPYSPRGTPDSLKDAGPHAGRGSVSEKRNLFSGDGRGSRGSGDLDEADKHPSSSPYGRAGKPGSLDGGKYGPFGKPASTIGSRGSRDDDDNPDDRRRSRDSVGSAPYGSRGNLDDGHSSLKGARDGARNSLGLKDFKDTAGHPSSRDGLGPNEDRTKSPFASSKDDVRSPYGSQEGRDSPLKGTSKDGQSLFGGRDGARDSLAGDKDGRSPYGRDSLSEDKPCRLPFGEYDRASPYADKDGRSPYGDKDGKSPYGDKDGKFPYGDKDGKYPHGDKDGRSPYGDGDGKYPHGDKDGKFPYGDKDGKFPYGDKDGKYLHGDKDGRSPYGDKDGKSPYGDKDGKYPHGDKDGKFPYGDKDGRSPYGRDSISGDKDGRSPYGRDSISGDKDGRLPYGNRDSGRDSISGDTDGYSPYGDGRSPYGRDSLSGDNDGRSPFGARDGRGPFGDDGRSPYGIREDGRLGKEGRDSLLDGKDGRSPYGPRDDGRDALSDNKDALGQYRGKQGRDSLSGDGLGHFGRGDRDGSQTGKRPGITGRDHLDRGEDGHRKGRKGSGTNSESDSDDNARNDQGKNKYGSRGLDADGDSKQRLDGRGDKSGLPKFGRGDSSGSIYGKDSQDKYGRAVDNEPSLYNKDKRGSLLAGQPGPRHGSAADDDEPFKAVAIDGIPLPPGAGNRGGGRINAKVTLPSGKTERPEIEDNGNGSMGVRYQPTEAGPHTLDIKYNGEAIQGSPYKFHATPLNCGKVAAYGPGLTHGVCGDPAKFVISTRGAGAGGLSLAVEGPSKADINCQDNKDGTVDVSFLPTAPGEYKISAKFADQHIDGSPFSCKITGEGTKRNAISVGSASELSLPENLSDFDLRSLQAYIISPSGVEEPCFLKKLPKGNNGISFTPREVGEHFVSVKRNGKHIKNSPFKITVNPDDVGDASRVKVTGPALNEGRTHRENTFTVDTKNAGYGGLSLSVEGPSKAEIKCKDNEDGTLDVSYKPTEPGLYIVNLKFADQHVPGSPFAVAVTGQGSEKQTGKIKRVREAVPITEVGSQCRLTFKMPGINAEDLKSSVASPTGKMENAVVAEIEDGVYAVNFVPYELGIHTVSVMYRDVDIPGSPFQFTVGPLQDGGAHRVHAGGPGLERGVQGQPADFNVWTREAGHGSLAISVEGPSKAEVDFKDRKDGSCHVSYVVEEPGEYSVGIRFNDVHIPGSPYKVYILPSADEAERVRLSNLADGPVSPNIPQTMLLNMNGAGGDVECKIISPSGREDDCFITPLGDGEHSVRFVPKEEGVHYLHAKLNGIHIPGSPFKLMVSTDRDTRDVNNDPQTVAVFGKGIERGVTGEPSKFVIDTSGVGAGTLSITVDGPSKVEMSCNEVDEGYEVKYTPMVPGRYFVTVKYQGKNVNGSPFSVNVSGENLAQNQQHPLSRKEETRSSSVTMETMQRTSYIRHQYSEQRASSSMSMSRAATRGQLMPLESHPSRVVCSGSGLDRAYVNRRNSFAVDCSKAGNNCLFVGVYGPEVPCEEVNIKHMGNKRYSVDYLVKEHGEYVIFVKWGDDHVPGSPFHIKT